MERQAYKDLEASVRRSISEGLSTVAPSVVAELLAEIDRLNEQLDTWREVRQDNDMLRDGLVKLITSPNDPKIIQYARWCVRKFDGESV